MHTLAATGDIRKVALWLGHASIQSTETYLRADPEEKLQIPRGARRPAIKPGRFKPPSDALITMLTDVRRRPSRLRTTPGTHIIWSEIMENRRKPAPPAATLDINCDCKEYVIDYLERAFLLAKCASSPTTQARSAPSR
jgi:hypothetical protein